MNVRTSTDPYASFNSLLLSPYAQLLLVTIINTKRNIQKAGIVASIVIII